MTSVKKLEVITSVTTSKPEIVTPVRTYIPDNFLKHTLKK